MLLEIQSAEKAFELPLSLSVLAYFTFGVTGALAALRRGYDIIGVVFLALFTAGGGGLIRDGMLLSSGPANILTDPRYLVAVVVAAMLTIPFHSFVGRFGRAIEMIDAAGLGAFAVIGTQITLDAGLSLPAAILGGTLTAVGGGLLRDVLVREEPMLFQPGQFYGLVAVGGACLYPGLVRYSTLSPHQSALVTISAVFVVRMLAIRFNWRTKARYRAPTPSG